MYLRPHRVEVGSFQHDFEHARRGPFELQTCEVCIPIGHGEIM